MRDGKVSIDMADESSIYHGENHGTAVLERFDH